MGKIFEFRPGSYTNRVSSEVGVNTNGEFARTDKGIIYRADGASKISYDFTPSVSDFTATCWAYRRTFDSVDESPMGMDGSSFQPFRIRDNSWSAYLSFDGSVVTGGGGTIKSYEWMHMITTWTSGIGINLYLNGVQVGENGYSITNDLSFSDMKVGFSSIVDYFKGDVGLCQIYDYVITPEERAKLYQSFLQAAPTTRTIR